MNLLPKELKLKDWQLDLIIPVPIHHLKKAERGYNQSDYLAKGLSKSLNIPYSGKMIKRIKYTESQTKLKMKERALNVSNAFKVRNAEKVKGKNILIVDDVCTTGATLLECGIALYKAGANSVFACSVAIAE